MSEISDSPGGCKVGLERREKIKRAQEGISGHASTTWELQRVTVVLGESDSKDEVRQTWMIVAVDDEANDLGEDPEYINPEMYDYKEM
jgi:hypothetical protein